ncbi:hypothetical protein PsorP6_002080 [Peronosclerospora sorghi]|uniref:Uncharacterized protein n=1 Tax=Peronosclerospora sorghi TaxID=230839 RepID=A0ACC0WVX1_9STRA|nr:hypothetical protein PsorP6_002080 [Peronosclerospora sorghi]
MHKASGCPSKCATKPPNVASQCQFCVRFGFYYLLLKGCVNLGSVPDRSDWFFDMTPVDYAARAIVHFAASRPVESLGQTLHIQNPSLPVKSDDFFAYFTAAIAIKRLETTADFTELKRSLLQGATIETALLELKKTGGSEKVFDSTLSSELLQTAGISCPSVNKELLVTYTAQWRTRSAPATST